MKLKPIQRLVFVICMAGTSLAAQSLESVLTNASAEGENANGLGLMFTVGEIAIETRLSGVTLDEGFLHPFCLLIIPTNEVEHEPTVLMYPNPVQATLRLRVTGTTSVSFEVFDVLGHLITAGRFGGGDFDLETTGWATGTYFLSLTTNSTHFQTYQFQKVN